MPRENSFSDTSGRSLTPDLEEAMAASSPVAPNPPPSTTPLDMSGITTTTRGPTNVASPTQPISPSQGVPRRDTVKSTRTTVEPYVPGRALAKWRAIARKVMHLNHASTAMAMRGAGAEPGVDPRRQSAYLSYGHIKQNCVIDIADYSTVRSSFGRMTNREFVQYISDPRASEREPWVKVRWINIAGVSYDVLSALSLKYDIHPLALEDILHQRSHSRSKADYYLKHLFIRLLCHSLGPDDEVASSINLDELVRTSSPTPMGPDDAMEMQTVEDDEKTVFGTMQGSRSNFSTRGSGRRKGPYGKVDIESITPVTRLNTFMNRNNNAANVRTIEELKRGDRVNVQTSPMSIILYRDGTVITVSSGSNLDFTTPIAARLRQRDTTLRASADHSLLVQSLLDLVVDKAVEVVDAYHEKILSLERDVLVKPDMRAVRSLHILSGDLTLHKRLLEPVKTMIYGLRRYDVDRVAALMDQSATPDAKIEGFMSHKSKIYLADVYDHMEYVLTSLDMFQNIAENLINYSFNLASYDMNEVMRRLTLATIIFLPLSLLTGYFGMNFGREWSVQNHSDVFFWIVALPVMAVVIPIFLWRDFVRMVHYVKKKMLARKVTASFDPAKAKKRQ